MEEFDKLQALQTVAKIKEEFDRYYPKWVSIKRLTKVTGEEEPLIYDVMYRVIQEGVAEQSATRDGKVVYRMIK